jgi:hypothetical protein
MEQPAADSAAPAAKAAGSAPPDPVAPRRAGSGTPNDKQASLDDVMIAMDVVDTVRHRQDLVDRELDEDGREADLMRRLKEIYRQQGIDVPDHVLAEGVKALKDSRFTYTPPPPSWKRTWLTMWVRRGRIAKVGGVALAVLLGATIYYQLTVARPARLAEEQARVEISETLPQAIHKAYADAKAIGANDPKAIAKADGLAADGERAIRDKDRAAMQRVNAELTQLRDEVARDYALTIVSRPGETSGVWRRPGSNPLAQNYYLVVEAVAPDGRKLRLPIRNEENGQIEQVGKFAVRVPKSTFDAVAADKRDDGIIQKNIFGRKRRGTLDVSYEMPFEGGMITRW